MLVCQMRSGQDFGQDAFECRLPGALAVRHLREHVAALPVLCVVTPLKRTPRDAAKPVEALRPSAL